MLTLTEFDLLDDLTTVAAASALATTLATNIPIANTGNRIEVGSQRARPCGAAWDRANPRSRRKTSYDKSVGIRIAMSITPVLPGFCHAASCKESLDFGPEKRPSDGAQERIVEQHDTPAYLLADSSEGGSTPPSGGLDAHAGHWLARITAALPHSRAQWLGLFDARGDLFANSDGKPPVDFRAALADSLDAFVLGAAHEARAARCEGAYAVMLAIRDDMQQLRGVLLLSVAEIDGNDADPAARFLTPAVREAIAAVGLSMAATADIPVVTPEVDTEATDRRKVSLDEVYAHIREQQLLLYVQQLTRSRTSESSRRFEVLLRHRSGDEEQSPDELLQTATIHGLTSMIDRRVVSQLISWLRRNPLVWKRDAPTFSINLSATALLEPHFVAFVEACLVKSQLPPALIGFEIEEWVCREHAAEAATACAVFARVGSPVTIDNFTLGGIDLPVLQSPCVRLVKLDSGLTSRALGDRTSEAKVVALVQAAKVLGLQSAAKRVEGSDLHAWLAALGVEFIQSFKTAPLRPLDSLIVTAAAPKAG